MILTRISLQALKVLVASGALEKATMGRAKAPGRGRLSLGVAGLALRNKAT